MSDITIVKLFKQHIEGTAEKSPVIDQTILVCHATKAVARACRLSSVKIYINTRIIKHLYDKKPAEEFNFLIKNIHTIVKYPDAIYKNKDSKRGHFAFTKNLKENNYLCSIEVVSNCIINEVMENANFIATGFRLRDNKYLKKYELMWSWKGGEPSS